MNLLHTKKKKKRKIGKIEDRLGPISNINLKKFYLFIKTSLSKVLMKCNFTPIFKDDIILYYS